MLILTQLLFRLCIRKVMCFTVITLFGITGLHGPDLSLSVFVWECSDGAKQTSHMGIFDMNRWYHAQMPATVR